jgi:hypothetical protein
VDVGTTHCPPTAFALHPPFSMTAKVVLAYIPVVEGHSDDNEKE